jgi:hypothetical protein
MSRVTLIVLLACALLVLVAVTAVASARTATETILVKTRSKTVSLRDNQTVTFSVACPGGYVAVSAGLSRPSLGAYQARVRPKGVNAYEFGISLSPTGSRTRNPRGTVLCARSPKTRLRVKTVRVALDVAPASESTKGLSCPTGMTPVGSGADPVYLRGHVSVTQATVTRNRLSFALRNVAEDYEGQEPERIVLYGSCLALRSGRGEKLEVKYKVLHRSVRSAMNSYGMHSYATTCPHGFVGLGTGYKHTRSAQMLANAASATGGSWSAWVGPDESARLTLMLACGRVVS